ncbi:MULTISPECIES: DMT family transporter [unclassified Streptomyces]|uniref:DMT family transporter n=1 Tax=unclassified Streptomyces TaxID=2593676 RepID=UPI00278BCAAE|nr:MULTISPECIES: DMT family transporter [unclassified Streptomyces]
MRAQNSATTPIRVAVADRPTPSAAQPGSNRPGSNQPGSSGSKAGSTKLVGTLLAAVAVTSFSLTFPATAWGLEGFGPYSLISVRCVLAALVAGTCLLALRVRPPQRRHWAGLAIVASGVVLGFPLLTTLALETATTAHSAVVVGLLPLTTAVYSSIRTGSRPSRAFWVAACAGAAAVIAFTVQQSGGALTRADLFLFAALLICAAAYAEGGRLASLMPGWQVIAWALVLCLPLAVAGAALSLPYETVHLTGHAMAGLLWVAVGAQFLGLVIWYKGMAMIGVPKASQLQLAQPLLTLVWSVVLLGEALPVAAPLTAVAVLLCIAVTQRARG